MKKLRLKHEYHDATLRAVRFEDRRLVLEADLDGHWNNKVRERALLVFEVVHNVDEIRQRLHCPDLTAELKLNDEIIGIVKVAKTRYLVDLSKIGPLEIDCRGIHEV